MLTQLPQITKLADCPAHDRLFDTVVLDWSGASIYDEFDFTQFKAGECYVKFKRTKLAKLNCQQLPVPSGFLGQPIVGNNISTLLVFGQPIHAQGGNLGKP